MRIGAVLVPLNTRLRTDDVAYILDQSESTTLILAERSGPIDYLGMVRELVPLTGASRLPKLRRPILLGDAGRPGTIAWTELLARGQVVDDGALAARAGAVDPGDLAFLMYTSGTTGFPKGVMHDHRMIRNVTDRAFRLAITEHDVIMMYLPLFHLFAFSEGMLTSMVSGARQVLTESFDAAQSSATRTTGSRATCRASAPASARPACRAPRRSRDARASCSARWCRDTG
jgi:fatty-acyl-CoA synthase